MFATTVRFMKHQLGHPARLNALLATDPALGYALELPPLSVPTASLAGTNGDQQAGTPNPASCAAGHGSMANTRVMPS